MVKKLLIMNILKEQKNKLVLSLNIYKLYVKDKI